MARTDANPPMPDFATDYELQEVDPSYLTASVKPKQFLHIDQAECILCEGCVDICPWKCIHMVSVSAIADAVEHRAARRGPARPRRVHRRRGHLHAVRALRRPLPDRRDHPRQAPARHRRGRPPRPHEPARLRLRRPVLSQPTGYSRRQVRGQRQRQQREQRTRRHRGEGRPGAGEDRREGPRLAGVDGDLPARARCSGAATPTAPATAPT